MEINLPVLLPNWENAKKAIAICTTIDEAKDIRDKAQALLVYVKQIKESLPVQNKVAEIRIRAERRVGEFSRELPKSAGGRPINSRHDGESFEEKTKASVLKAARIDPTHAARYEAIANIPQERFEDHLQTATGKGIELTTVSMVSLAKNIAREERSESTVTPPHDPNKYRIIYADPPWEYDADFMDKYGHAEAHYKTMTMGELSELPVKDMAEKDCVLFLWATSPKLKEAVFIMESWGFNYKTSFVWDKIKHNFGHYNSVRHEFLLIGGIGKSTPDIKELHDSVISIERSEIHSEKPEYFRNLIDSLYTHGNRIELFARGLIPNSWKSWGFESEN